MGDFFVNLGRKPVAHKVIQTLGLPVPLPQYLARADGPWAERFLEGEPVVVGHLPGGVLARVLAPCLWGTGEALVVAGTEEQCGCYRAQGEVTILSGESVVDGMRPRALVFDTTGIEGGRDLRAGCAVSPRAASRRTWRKP